MGIRVALNHKTRLSLYQARVAFAPCGATAARAAHPHADHQLFAEGYAGRTFHQLAAGSLQQSAWRVWSSPRRPAEFSVEVDLVADMTVTNPFDFFLEKYAEEYPFEYDPVLRGSSLPTCRMRAAGPQLEAVG